MTKSELIARMAERHPHLEQGDSKEAVKMILDVMIRFLVEGHRIEIRYFGSFACLHRPPRVGRNPKTGEPVQIPATYVPHFRPGRELRLRVDGTRDEAQAMVMSP